MNKTIGLKIGDRAPEFVLKDQDGKEVRLSQFKGKKALLSFHPLAWTKVCAEQMKALEQNDEAFKRVGAVAFGLSVDTVPAKSAWAKELGITRVRLLSDFWPHGGVARAYGIFRDQNGFSERANIIIDENQRIAFAKIYEIPQLPDIQEIISFLRK